MITFCLVEEGEHTGLAPSSSLSSPDSAGGGGADLNRVFNCITLTYRLNDGLVLWCLTPGPAPVGYSPNGGWLVARTVSLAVVPGGGRVGGVVELLCPGHLDPGAAPGQTIHLVGGGAGGVDHTLQLGGRHKLQYRVGRN